MPFRNPVRRLDRLQDVSNAASASAGKALVKGASAWEPGELDGIEGMLTTGPLTLYLDQAAGNDANDGLTAGTARASWAGIEQLLPRFLLHGVTVNIVGGYTGTITVYGRFAGNGALTIQGSTGVAANHVVNAMRVRACVFSADVLIIQHLQLSTELLVTGVIGFSLRSLRLRNPAGTGVRVNGSMGTIDSCDFGAAVVQDCIEASYAGTIYTNNNSGSGTRYGLRATRGATIAKSGTQPTGATANENSSGGGVIR